MNDNKTCSCDAASKLIFPCSGAADVGELADRAARKMSKEGKGKMYCLAGIGGGVKGIIDSTGSSSKILVLDGCRLSCAKNCLEKAGFNNFEYINLADAGMQKGSTVIDESNIEKIAKLGEEKLSCRGTKDQR